MLTKLKRIRSKLYSTFIILLAVGAFGIGLERTARARTMRHASATAGYDFDRYRVPANSTHTFTRYFMPGQIVLIAVAGDRTTDLDVYVYDSFGRLVAMDEDYTDQFCVEFPVHSTGAYTIRVVNRGSSAVFLIVSSGVSHRPST